MNRIYREYLGADRPARATVGASLTAPAYNVEMTFVASSSPRQGIEIAAEPNPNLSAAVRAGNALFVSGMLAEGDALKEGGGAQTRDILRRLDAVLAKAAFARADVRELLVYVTDDQSGRDAAAECRTAFGANTAVTLVTVGLALTGSRVEIMSYAERG
jgi:enamine deaminase RidA (YjgF/YER057c/UK114 family)